MSLIQRWLRRWPIYVGALAAAGIVHICTVFALPHVYRSDAVLRLQRTLPLHSFVILPPAQPGAQVIPYQQPHTRYAVCRFDVRDGPVAVKATLPEPGWMLTAYAPGGESFYTMPASSERRISVDILMLPGGERFLGPLYAARNLDIQTSQVTSPARTGLVVLQAPMKGRTYTAETEQALAQASCRKLSF